MEESTKQEQLDVFSNALQDQQDQQDDTTTIFDDLDENEVLIPPLTKALQEQADEDMVKAVSSLPS